MEPHDEIIDAEVVDEADVPSGPRWVGVLEHEPMVSLGALRDAMAEPGGARSNLYVGRNGEIIQGQPGSRSARPLAELTRETFAAPNLDRIAEQIRRSQATGNPDPDDADDQLWVDPSGDIRMGGAPDTSRLSKLTQETFATTTANRREREERVALTKLPPNTVHVSDGTYDGWAYDIVNEFLDHYRLFLYYDPASSRYKVSLIAPRMEGTVDGHGCHLYSNGVLCLNEGANGYKSMERAYARSVLWTRGASCYQRGLGFQFNRGQAG